MAAPGLATEQMIPFYAQHHIAMNQPSKHATVQSDHAARKVKDRVSGNRSNFSGGYFSNESDPQTEVHVKLIANDGRTVYAGSCVFLELSYARKLEDGTTVEV